MNLSKSKYCSAVQCKKMLWLDVNKHNEKGDLSNESVLDNGTLVHEVAKELLGTHIDIEFNKKLAVMIDDTRKALESKEVVISEASFKYENSFCSIDLLRKTNDEYEIYEVKGATSMDDIYITDLAYQLHILLKLGYKVTKCNIVLLNSEYVRYGDLELDKLFVITDVTDDAYERQDEIEKTIIDINNYMLQTEEPAADVDNKCFKPYMCPFFNYCTKHLPENNVFDIRRMRTSTKIKLYKKGSYSFNSLLTEDIDDKYKQQIEYELYKKPDYIDKVKIKDFLDTLSYPIYFLDFETFQMPIPQYDGVSPYEQIPFQYSLHYIEDDKLKHKEFLAEAGVDPRRELAESLVSNIPLDVCTLAYNMSFEKTVIRKLGEMYPDLKENLMNIHDNMKDLMIPFKDRYYYTKDMHGSYSIKYVLPALFPNGESLNYQNLDLIHNGAEAMSSFLDLGNKPKEEQDNIKKSLLKYCELDTYAMVKIYDKLKEIIE